MACPKCGAPVAPGAWICPACDHILDPSVLGEAPVPDAEAFGESTRMVAWEGDLSASEPGLPDAMILGDVSVDTGEFAVMSGAGAGPDGRTSTFLYYSASSPSRLINPDAVPRRQHRRAVALTPYEDFVLQCVDGHRSVRQIRQLAGLAVEEVVITLLTLLDKQVILLPAEADEERLVVPTAFDTHDQDEETLGLVSSNGDDYSDLDVTMDGSVVPPALGLSAGPEPWSGFDEEEEEATAMLSLSELENRHERTHEGIPELDPAEVQSLDAEPLDASPPRSHQPPSTTSPPSSPAPAKRAKPRLPTAHAGGAAPVAPDAFNEDFGSLLAEVEPLADFDEGNDASAIIAAYPLDASAPALDPAELSPLAPTARAPESVVPPVTSRPQSVVPPPRGGPRLGTRPASIARPVREVARSAPGGPRKPPARASGPDSPISTDPADGITAEAAAAASKATDPVMASKASKLFDQALVDQSDGNLVSARMNMKLALTFDPGNAVYLRALESLAQSPSSKRPEGRNQARELYEAATEAENEGDYDEAIRLLEKAIGLSKQAAFHNRLGVILAMKKAEFERALELVERAIELAPGNAIYERNLQKILGMAATKGMKKEKKAKRSFFSFFRRK